MNIKNIPIILASSAHHRSKILKENGIEHSLISSNIVEKWDYSDSYQENTKKLALQKAQKLQKKHPNAIIIAADTVIISSEGKIYFKPKNRKEAEEYLKKRSGSTEEVSTGFCIMYQSMWLLDSDSTFIYYRNIPQEEQKRILDTEEWKGVCGGLRIEGELKKYVEKIKGSYENIIGLPIQKIKKNLEIFGR